MTPEKIKEVNTQIGTSFIADFEESTWTFLMPDGFQVWAGEFAIVDKQVYERMLAALKNTDFEVTQPKQLPEPYSSESPEE